MAEVDDEMFMIRSLNVAPKNRTVFNIVPLKSVVYVTSHKARNTLGQTVDFVVQSRPCDRVALAPYTLATKSTVSATKFTVYGNSRRLLCCRFRQQSTFNKVDRVEFNSVPSVYRPVLRLRSTFCTVKARHEASRGLFATAELLVLISGEEP